MGLSRGRNAMAIWQDLVADTGFSGSYQSVKRFVRKLRGTQPVQARAEPEDARTAAQSTEGFLVELGPNAGTGAEAGV